MDTASSLHKFGRSHLATRIETIVAELQAEPDIQVLLAGEFNAGKTALLNALVNEDLGPPHPLTSTQRPVVVRFGAQRSVVEVWSSGETNALSIRELGARNTDPSLDDEVSHYVVHVPSPFLRSGLTLIDTPSLSGGLASAQASRVLGFAYSCRAVLLVSDGTVELSGPQAEFLETLADLGDPLIACVLTKCDVAPHADEIADVNRIRLANMGRSGPVLQVSSALYSEGRLFGDDERIQESGIERLRWYLSSTLLADLMQARSTDALAQSASLVTEARVSLANELDAIRAAGGIEELSSKLSHRSQQLERLATGLQAQVGHQLGLLTADLNSFLERGARELRSSIDDLVTEGDPLRSWSSMEGQIRELGIEFQTSHYRYLAQRREQLIAQLVDYAELEADRLGLAETGEGSPTGETQNSSSSTSGSQVDGYLSDINVGAKMSSFEVLRGAAGGMLTTTGTIGTLAGLAQGTALAGLVVAAAPFVVPVGLVGAAWTFKSLSVRRKEGTVNAARQAARKQGNAYATDLLQGVKESTSRVQLDLRAWLTESLNRQLPTLKAELGADLTRIKELSDQTVAERQERIDNQLASVAILEQQAATLRRLVITLRRPELQAAAR